MTRLYRICKTLAEAELFQDGLYEKYEHVILLRAPLFSEDGCYIWEVTN